MKHIPYRQNPTVIDTSKKARPPPGTLRLIYELSNHLNTAYNTYTPVRAFRTGVFCCSKNFLKKFQKIFGVFQKRRIAAKRGKHHQLSNEKGGENVKNLIAGSFTNNVLFRSFNTISSALAFILFII